MYLSKELLLQPMTREVTYKIEPTVDLVNELDALFCSNIKLT